MKPPRLKLKKKGNDIETGKLLWSQNTEGIRFRSSPVVSISGKLFSCSELKIFRLHAATGKIEKMIKTPFNLEVTSRPLVLEDKIIVSTADAGIAAFDLNSGKLLWNFETGPALVYSSPYTQKEARTVETSLVLKGHLLLFGAMDGKFYAVNVNNGQCEWSTDLGGPILSTVAISGGIVYVADYGGNLYAYKCN